MILYIVLSLQIIIIVLIVWAIWKYQGYYRVSVTKAGNFDNPDTNAEMWLKEAAKEDGKLSIDILESGFIRYPDSRELFSKLYEEYEKRVNENDDIIRRRDLILRFKELCALFKRSCELKDIEYANDTNDKVADLAAKFYDEVKDKIKGNIEKQLNELKKNVDKLKNTENGGKIMDEIENLDQKINKNEMRSYDDLQKKYADISKSLTEYLNEKDKQELHDEYRQYNEKALKSLRKIWDEVNDQKGLFGKAKNVDINRIAKMVGGWDTQKLFPSTASFLSTVYADIFQRLKNEDKVKLTELMIKEQAKR